MTKAEMVTMATASPMAKGSAASVVLNWLDRELPDPQDQREYSRERVVVAVNEAIAEAMEAGGVRRADIAKVLGKSKSQISQILNGKRNMTLRTLGDILWACNQELDALLVSQLGSVACNYEQAAEWDGSWKEVTIEMMEIFGGVVTARKPESAAERGTPVAARRAIEPSVNANNDLEMAA